MGGRLTNARRNWPRGLYKRVVRGRAYYFYRGSGAPKDVHLGTDLVVAKHAVGTLNARRAEEPVQAALRKLERTRSTVAEHVNWYKNRLEQKRSLRGKPLGDQTLYEYNRILGDIAERLSPSKAVADVDRRAIADILESLPGWTSNRYRSLLRDLFRHAVARGLRDDSPAELTIAKDVSVVRQRLTYEAFSQILENSSPWMQRALNLALWSLQREGDLVLLRADDHWREGRLRLAQSKVQRHGTGRLAIKPGPHLLAAILACLNSPERDPSVATNRHDTADWGPCLLLPTEN